MIQSVIAYIIIGAAAGYAVCSLVKKLRKKDNINCSDCSCCNKKLNCSRDVSMFHAKMDKH